MAQTDRATAGFTRGLGYVFGDLGRILGAHFSIPDWMWEGDAVGIETALGSAGRGRMPEFDNEIRALPLADRLPTYRQAVHGSLARYFPNEYPLGYTLTTYLRRTQGADIIGRLFGRSGARAYDPLAFEHALKHETGMSAPALFDSEYKMPLAYPDLALGPIAYIKRVQATGFYDHAVGRGGGPSLTNRSAGVELTANTTQFSWDVIPFAPGLQYVYRAGLGHRLEPMVAVEF